MQISLPLEKFGNSDSVGKDKPNIGGTTMASLLFTARRSEENIEIGEAFREELKKHLDECLKGISYYMTELLCDKDKVSITLQCTETVFEDVKREVENYFGMHCEFERFRPRELEG